MTAGLVTQVVFFAVALFTVSCAVYATFSRNIVRAVFSLLGTFGGVAILYGFLSADFIAVIQIMIYVGGILVLMVFAVMLTGNIEDASSSSRSAGLWLGASVGAGMFFLLAVVALKAPWHQVWNGVYTPVTDAIGEYLLHEGLLPFETLSVILLAVVIGAVVVARFAKPSGKPIEENEE